MPVWHAKAQKLVDEGKLAIVGLVQEQHADRCRLYLQWQKIDWPMMHDPINLTRQSAVPIITAIDEYGIVRLTRCNPETIEHNFVIRSYPKPSSLPPAMPSRPPDLAMLRSKSTGLSPSDTVRYADAEILWGGINGLDNAVDAYKRAISIGDSDPALRFRLGVAYRMRYDSAKRRDEDFRSALESWQDALDKDPNEYIWRRRIQQYGPRLEKPYPFYDWVATARLEIKARGEAPIPLTAEPGGAELAAPIRSFATNTPAVEPDPKDRITRDTGDYVRVETAVAPARVKPGGSARVHLIFRPINKSKAHWNNEAEPLRAWVRPPAGWQCDTQLIELTSPKQATSTELREVEFEIRVPDSAIEQSVSLAAYALYNVCEGAHGQCLYRRQDILIPIRIVNREKEKSIR